MEKSPLVTIDTSICDRYLEELRIELRKCKDYGERNRILQLINNWLDRRNECSTSV